MLKRTVTGLIVAAYTITMILLGKTALVINTVLLLLIGTHEYWTAFPPGGFIRSSGFTISMRCC